MHLSKSYRLLRFLNRRHPAPLRAAAAAGGAGIALLSSFRPRLAGRVAAILWRDDFKTGMRLAHWLLRRGWSGLEIANDRYFDFASCFEPGDLDDLEAFLKARARPANAFEDAVDALFLLASRAHLALERGDIAAFERARTAYESLERTARALSPAALPAAREKDKPNVFSKEDATSALRDFSALAERGGFVWYVVSGTFLGIVRENGWLAHDYDIDLGVNAEAVDLDALRRAISSDPAMVLRKEDWQKRIVMRDGRPTLEKLPVMLKIVHRTGINIDVFVHHLEDGTRWHGSSIQRWDNREFGLAQYRLAGIPVLGPADSDRYLTENYGDWRTPVTEFNSTTGTPNMVPVNNYSSRALFIRRQIAVRYAADSGAGEDHAFSASESPRCV